MITGQPPRPIYLRNFSDGFDKISAGRTPEQYFSDKMDEYFEGYDIICYTDEISEPQKLRRYRKKPGFYGYVRSTDIAPAGREVRIRTLEGDVSIKCKEDIYIMIGILGEVYPLEANVFNSKYTPLDEPFTEELEYAPSVTDIAADSPCGLIPFARKCR